MKTNWGSHEFLEFTAKSRATDPDLDLQMSLVSATWTTF